MKKGFVNYTSEELLLNNSFMCWKLFSSEADKAYWEKVIMENPDIQKEVDKASKVLDSVKLNDSKLSLEEKETILQVVRERIDKKKKTRKFYFYLSGAACACIIALFFFMATQEYFFHTEEAPIAMVNRDTLDEKNIQLILSDNDVMTFEEDAEIKYQEDGNVIVESKDKKQTTRKVEIKKEEVTFNELIVPKGKRSFLTLEDGTKVWVNSGTNIRFPSVFQAGKREVYVDGEIYIEVAKDKDKPFFVNTSEMKVEVLGTRFNVSAYKEEDFQSVVLVEGKVEVEIQDNKNSLYPDMMLAIVNREEVKVQKVDVYNYISWKDGLLQFSSESLNNILRKVARYYDVSIEYDDIIADMACSGKLVLFDNITDVMESIYNTIPITYEIEGDRIKIQKR